MIVKKCEKCKKQNNPKSKTCVRCGATLEGIKEERIPYPWHFGLVTIALMILAMGILFVANIPIYWLTIGISAGVSGFLASLIYYGSIWFPTRDKKGK